MTFLSLNMILAQTLPGNCCGWTYSVEVQVGALSGMKMLIHQGYWTRMILVGYDWRMLGDVIVKISSSTIYHITVQAAY